MVLGGAEVALRKDRMQARNVIVSPDPYADVVCTLEFGESGEGDGGGVSVCSSVKRSFHSKGLMFNNEENH